jgi:hypothetical protein
MRKSIALGSGAFGTFAASSAFAAADYSGLAVDLTGLDAAAVGIATALMAVLGVFWGLRRIMGLVG